MLALPFSSPKLQALIEAQSVGEREHSARFGWHLASQPPSRVWLLSGIKQIATRPSINETRNRPFERRNRFGNDAGSRGRGRLRNIRALIRLRPASLHRNGSGSTRRQIVRRKSASHRKNRPARLRRLRAHRRYRRAEAARRERNRERHSGYI